MNQHYETIATIDAFQARWNRQVSRDDLKIHGGGTSLGTDSGELVVVLLPDRLWLATMHHADLVDVVCTNLLLAATSMSPGDARAVVNEAEHDTHSQLHEGGAEAGGLQFNISTQAGLGSCSVQPKASS